jgi:hypothetical protein
MIRVPAWILVVTLLPSLVAGTGCTRWEQIPVADVESAQSDLVGQKVRVYTDTETVDMVVSEVSSPWLIGNDYTDGFFPEVRVDVADISRVETEHPEAQLGNFLLVAGGVLVLAGIVVAVALAAGGNDEWNLINL